MIIGKEPMEYHNINFGKLRICVKDNKVFFMGRDIATCLNYSNTKLAISDNVPPDYIVLGETLGLTNTNLQHAKFITEVGLKHLLKKSKMPSVNAFKAWIDDTIMPSITKTFSHLYTQSDLIEYNCPTIHPDIQYNVTANTVPKNYLEALEVLVEKEKEKLVLEEKIKEHAHKISFYDALDKTADTISVGDYAKLLCKHNVIIGRNRLYKWFRDKMFINKDNKPYQAIMDTGRLSYIEHIHTDATGEPRITFVVRITGKGQKYFAKLIAADFQK